jgi:RNA polymerase primary sigma factor
MTVDENIFIYFNDIKNIPIMSDDEELKLITSWLELADSQARDIVIQNNLKLVISVAKSYINLGLSFDDLIQEGNIGLMYAIDTFNKDYGVKLSTYATWWIRHHITRAISNKARLIRVPAAILEAKKEVDIQDPLSLDMPVGEGSDDTYRDTVIDYVSKSPEDIVMRQQLKENLTTVMNTLENREATILDMRFGLTDGHPRTLEEVGDHLRLSKERVRQLERAALRKLRNPVRKKMLEGFV